MQQIHWVRGQPWENLVLNTAIGMCDDFELGLFTKERPHVDRNRLTAAVREMLRKWGVARYRPNIIVIED